MAGNKLKSQMPWPQGCKYYHPASMHAAALEQLIAKDSDWIDTPKQYSLRCVRKAGSGFKLLQPYTRQESIEDLLRGTDGPGPPSFFAVFVRQARIYLPNKTYSKFYLDEQMWRNILLHGDVLPSFLEILHTNNSANVSHIWHFSGNERPESLHLVLKVGRSHQSEFALYARQELKTGRVFLLFAGTQSQYFADALPRRTKGCKNLDIFSAILMILELSYANLESRRWALDHTTRELESQAGMTGYGGLRQKIGWKGELDHVTFTKNLHRAMHLTRTLAWASARFADMATFLLDQLDLYRNLLEAQDRQDLSETDASALKSAFKQRHALSNGQSLSCDRLHQRQMAQMDITRALIAARDMRVTIDTAAATARDSEVMRSIATVTMIFLPATFVATFFSMVFFQGAGAGNGFAVEKQIWLYPVVSVPLTAIVGFLFVPSWFPNLYGRASALLARCVNVMKGTGPKKLE